MSRKTRRYRMLITALFSLFAAAPVGAQTDPTKAAARPRPLSTPTVVQVAQGRVAGKLRGAVIHFYGIPYAASPVGERRWTAPEPPQSWTGIRDATKPKIACSQPNADASTTPITNEDCLNLNVTGPVTGAKTKPVMVWLHGGGLSTGSSNDYDPSRMAAQGDVIVVTVESRISVMGYFAHPGLAGSGAFGLQDEESALKWVRANIKAFGGDPGNVTLFGESGGASRTCAHMTSPLSTGFFDKAILQSGGCTISWPLTMMPGGTFWIPLADAEAQGKAFAQNVGCPGDNAAQLACLRKLPIEKLLAEGGSVFGSAAYGTTVLPLQPTKALETGQFSAVPMLSGSNRDEGRALVGFLRFFGNPMTDKRYAQTLKDSFGPRAEEVHARYPQSAYAGHPDAPALAWASVITDRMFACPQLKDMRLVGAAAPVYGYLFNDPNGIGLVPFPTGFPSGASHSSELPLLFDLTTGAPLDFGTQKTIQLTEAQKALGATMIQYWTRFAHEGNPNKDGLHAWPAYQSGDGKPKFLQLAPAPLPIKPVDSDAIHQCEFWEPFLK